MSTLLAVLLLAGCAKTGSLDDLYAPRIWSEYCPNSDPERSWLQLRSDGSFAHSYEAGPSYAWEHDSDETWTLKGDVLTVSWNGGYAVTEYWVDQRSGDVIPGKTSKSCGDTIQLQLVR